MISGSNQRGICTHEHQIEAILAIPTSTSSTLGLRPFLYNQSRLISLTLNTLSLPSPSPASPLVKPLPFSNSVRRVLTVLFGLTGLISLNTTSSSSPSPSPSKPP